ncbi:MAG: tRNA (5-methylaminomethyl-2-thiouridine)(34)-methyltransferase MnmD [Tannerella sp.]|jgi:tRNA U34 5-methylaminomethyl-2-thiouridine-forming methyltransferase MnmC|nr:tRNA (5-methylaminomethyl-2-thiouridine)(34)-methyltransferase MnmD [Tannerella sp.]
MKLQQTADNSYTLFSTKAKQTYHSMEGAIMEAKHVYVTPALTHFQDKNELHILEIGFGTGLNTIITLLESQKANKTIFYETIEAYPVPKEIYYELNYPEKLSCNKEIFLELHEALPGEIKTLQHFSFLKKHTKIEDYIPDQFFDIIYFDAFSPDAQPELWTAEIFNKMFHALAPNGILLTYSAKGTVKRALRAVGFEVKRLPGAGSKHHMLVAEKNSAN